MTIKTRFAPSPTGYLHIGGVRTALFSWLYAKQQQGTFVLRIEDTDRERSTNEAVAVIQEGMAWCGLQHDEGPFFQTQRFDRYKAVIQQLLDEGKAYYCYCSKEYLYKVREEQMQKGEKPRYDGYWRDRDEAPPEGVSPVVRFKNPLNGEVVFKDLIKGEIRVSNTELDDLIIARSDGTPTYNLTVVVDDWDMGITHVVRGDDHVNNTPRQINILQALGAPIPQYAHASMILGQDGQRLSKRHGAVNILNYRDDGYLPQALLNYLVRLGWSYGDQEVFSVEEMIELFRLDDVNVAAAKFDAEKLLWLNQQYIKTLPAETLLPHLQYQLQRLGMTVNDSIDLLAIIRTQAERAKTLVEMAEASHFFFTETVEYNEKAVKKNLKPTVREPLKAMREQLAALEDWKAEPIHDVIEAVAAQFELKMGKVAQPLRVSVTGNTVSPSIDLTVELIGKQRTLLRMDEAIGLIAE